MTKISAAIAAAFSACIFPFVALQAHAAAATVKGNDVLILGDSFFALSGQIKTDLEKLARTDGYIGSGESFRSAAMSGAKIANITS